MDVEDDFCRKRGSLTTTLLLVSVKVSCMLSRSCFQKPCFFQPF
jgi:hypothetical protein